LGFELHTSTLAHQEVVRVSNKPCIWSMHIEFSVIYHVMMTLTDEQKKRIRINRERALEIRGQRDKECAVSAAKKESNLDGKAFDNLGSGELSTENNAWETNYVEKVKDNDEEDEEIEHFEKGASPYVSKREAMKTYCLPSATLSIRAYMEKPNAKHSKWNPMRLYFRKEISRRARTRFGGVNGLKEERTRRQLKRYEKDFNCTKRYLVKKGSANIEIEDYLHE